MTYRHLTEDERTRIGCLLQAGISAKQIALQPSRSVSTLYRERARNGKRCVYDASVAQNRARQRASHHVMAPMEFMQRLAAMVPRPRLHLIRFHSVLAPNAKLRKAVVPVPPAATAPAHAGDCAHTPAGSAQGRLRWAQMLKRVFDIDTEHCPHCGGQLKRIAAIEEPVAIARILTHLGLAAQPPQRAPAVRVDLFEAA